LGQRVLGEVAVTPGEMARQLLLLEYLPLVDLREQQVAGRLEGKEARLPEAP